MRKFALLASFAMISTIVIAQDFEQFQSKGTPVYDTFYERYVIEDQYRWLEKVNSEEVIDWIGEQNKFSKKHLSKIRGKNKIKNELSEYADAQYFIPGGNPSKYSFMYGYYTEVSTPALMYKGPGMHDPKVLVDPDDISLEDNIFITGVWASKDEQYMVYQFSRNGSDKSEAKIVAMEDGIHMPDHLKDIMFSNIEWYKDGFFYSTLNRVNEFGVNDGQKVFYHKVGSGQFEDKLIFERKKYPLNRYSFEVTHDDQYFVLTESYQDQEKHNVFYFDLETGNFQVKPLVTNFTDEIEILDSHNGKFIASTSMGSDNGVLFEIDPALPRDWKPLSPVFKESVLESVILLEKRIVAVYLTGHPFVTVLDYESNVLYSLELPHATSAKIISQGHMKDYIYFYYSSYTIPPIVFKLDINTFEKKLVKKTSVNYDFEEIVTKEIEYVSGDGSKVPMTIVHRKGIKLDGTNPTLLEAYGGFGIKTLPSFNPGVVYLINQGGVYAFAHIRGGGEKGKSWSDDGKGKFKQNSFDDFIAAAEYLIDSDYTSPEMLAISGTSNGGLVVSAAAIQRPELFKVVVPKVAPLDMLRYEKFTQGSNWIDEYGTTSDSSSFKQLMAYSPYYNIKEDVNYPTMLIITSTNDDRVPPFHSYKFAAALQNRKAQKNPIFLKIEKQAGHYGAITVKSSWKELIDFYGFILENLVEPTN